MNGHEELVMVRYGHDTLRSRNQVKNENLLYKKFSKKYFSKLKAKTSFSVYQINRIPFAIYSYPEWGLRKNG